MLDRDEINYTTLKLYADEQRQERKKRGIKAGFNVANLLVLARQNDPFYAGNDAGVLWGRWFARMWEEHEHGRRGAPTVHVRGLHYDLVGLAGTSTPVIMPGGKIYENTEACWKKLELAGKYARNNGFLQAELFEDRRTPQIRLYESERQPLAKVEVYTPELEIAFPEFPPQPFYDLTYENVQHYRIEIWCEKSTQERRLLPIIEKYGANLLAAQGELSITAMLQALDRARLSGKPTRILYVSDFDPAGRSMPVAASRKLEFWLQKVNPHGDIRQRLALCLKEKGAYLDIQLYPIALTVDQCIQYQLDRTPIKVSERRKGAFEGRYGTGATELDALEAKYPGELVRLVEREILRFYDETLDARTNAVEQEARVASYRMREQVQRHHSGTYEALHDEYAQLQAEFDDWVERRFKPFQERLSIQWDAVSKEMRERAPDLAEYPLPDGKFAPERNDCLYSSARSYLEQLAAYQEFTGKFAHLIPEEEEGGS